MQIASSLLGTAKGPDHKAKVRRAPDGFQAAAEPREGTKPSRAAPAEDPRDSGELWTTAKEDRGGSSPGDLDVALVGELGNRSACFGEIPKDSEASTLTTARALDGDSEEQGGPESPYLGATHP
ncbi:hypothetical protein UY3_18632 [Chelonia mydas]|uniref:Uncharacterized protein n=1 Tax=Chelonia mydas TaxID=8469 RepID=M7AJ63_CHEMY|nr:hypothetical protein UY3_18632 [Chelonia mydas]